MASPRLNKRLYNEITRLKLLSRHDSNPRFILDRSPFDNQDELTSPVVDEDDIVIIGRIFPNTEIYNQGSYQIMLKIGSTYPRDPPKVTFITKIYHPNVSKDGNFCYELFDHLGIWTRTNSLVDMIKIVMKYIDEPDLEMFEVTAIAEEYLHNRSRFNQMALEYVKNYALPRFSD